MVHLASCENQMFGEEACHIWTEMHFKMLYKERYYTFPVDCHDSFYREAEDVEDANDSRAIEPPVDK